MTQRNNERYQSAFLKRHSVYFVGIGLSFICAFGVNFIGGDTVSTKDKLEIALLMGIVMWPFFMLPQILLQWAICKIIRGRFDGPPLLRQIIVNSPIIGLIIYCWINQYCTTRPSAEFERLIIKPIPKSVQTIQQGHIRALDSVFWVLSFDITNADLKSLLDKQLFASNLDWENIEYLNDRIRSYSKLGITITTNWQSYILKSGGTQKYIFYNPSNSAAVFILDSH